MRGRQRGPLTFFEQPYRKLLDTVAAPSPVAKVAGFFLAGRSLQTLRRPVMELSLGKGVTRLAPRPCKIIAL